MKFSSNLGWISRLLKKISTSGEENVRDVNRRQENAKCVHKHLQRHFMTIEMQMRKMNDTDLNTDIYCHNQFFIQF